MTPAVLSGPGFKTRIACRAFAPQSVPPDFHEDFSLYNDAAHFLTDPFGYYADAQINAGQIGLVTSPVYPGYTKALRYRYPEGTGTDYTISPGVVDFPAAQVLGGTQTEVWCEYALRFASGFTLLGNGQGGGIGLKAMFINTTPVPSGGRWGIQLSNNDSPDIDIEGPNDDYNDLFMRIDQTGIISDGLWHVVRRHARVSGSFKYHTCWVDGVMIGQVVSSGAAANTLTNVEYFKNLNRMPPADQDLFIGYFKAWKP